MAVTSGKPVFHGSSRQLLEKDELDCHASCNERKRRKTDEKVKSVSQKGGQAWAATSLNLPAEPGKGYSLRKRAARKTPLKIQLDVEAGKGKLPWGGQAAQHLAAGQPRHVNSWAGSGEPVCVERQKGDGSADTSVGILPGELEGISEAEGEKLTLHHLTGWTPGRKRKEAVLMRGVGRLSPGSSPVSMLLLAGRLDP